MVSVLTTDGGPHPPEKWAQVTAERLLPDTPAASVAALMRLRANVMDLLTAHHEAAQVHERDCLANDPDHSSQPHHGPTDLEGLVSGIQELAAGTPWSEHLAKPEVVDVMKDIITQHTVGLRHVERLWHADSK